MTKTKDVEQYCKDMRGNQGFCVNLCGENEGYSGLGRMRGACKSHSYAISIIRKRKTVVDVAEVHHV